MSDRAREFLQELKLRWDDSYFWADHQWLTYILLCSILFVYELGTHYLKLRMRASMTPTLGD
jgi:hypothetical protein